MRLNKLSPVKGNVPANRDEHVHPMFAFQKEINHLFENFFQDASPGGLGTGLGFGLSSPNFFDKHWDPLTPKVDVSESDGKLMVAVELPGLSEEDFDVSIQGSVLSIRGEKKQESEDSEKGWYRVERHFGSFERTVPLPYEVNQEEVKAEFKNGVLKIWLPKQTEKPETAKRIAVRKG